MASSTLLQDQKLSECKISMNLPVPVKYSLKILALFLLLLQKSWMSLTATAVIFTVVYIVFGGWISCLFLLICTSCKCDASLPLLLH